MPWGRGTEVAKSKIRSHLKESRSPALQIETSKAGILSTAATSPILHPPELGREISLCILMLPSLCSFAVLHLEHLPHLFSAW